MSEPPGEPRYYKALVVFPCCTEYPYAYLTPSSLYPDTPIPISTPGTTLVLCICESPFLLYSLVCLFHILVIPCSICLSVWLTSVSMMFSESIHVASNGEILFYGWVVFHWFSETTIYCFPQCLYKFTFSPTVYKCSLYSTSSPTFVTCVFDDSPSDRCKVILWFWLAFPW